MSELLAGLSSTVERTIAMEIEKGTKKACEQIAALQVELDASMKSAVQREAELQERLRQQKRQTEELANALEMEKARGVVASSRVFTEKVGPPTPEQGRGSKDQKNKQES